MSLDTRIRWIARHGLAGGALRLSARRGQLDGRLMSDPQLRADPFAAYDEIRAAGPFYDGMLTTTTAHHALCTEILRSDAFGVGVDRDRMPRLARTALAVAARKKNMSPIDPPSLLAIDPPDHTRLRKLVTRVFTVRAMEGLRPRVEQTADELLTALEGRTGVDLVEAYCAQLPVIVIAEILGVPVEMRDQFLEWGSGGAVSLDIGISHAEFVRAETAVDELYAWMLGHFDRLRRDPGDDLLSRLVTVADEDGTLTQDELAGLAMLLLGAGFETTVNLLGNGVVQLLAHPDQLTLLRAEPELWANAVEEVLRYDSPVQRTARVVKRDVEIAGTAFRPGQLVVTLLGGANRDPQVFDDPHRFDVRRPNAREHLAFSSGIHFCLGAALAKIEGEIGLRRLFERFPDLALDGAPHRRPLRVLRGYDAMPVRLGAPARTAERTPEPQPA